jgi:GTP-binding protein HflX
VLEEIGAGAVPRLIVMNKADLLENGARRAGAHDAISISAKNSVGLDELLEAIAQHLTGSREEISVTFPAARGDLLAMARRDGEVLSEEYVDGLVSMRARVSAPVAGRLKKAAVELPHGNGSTIA